MPIWTCRQRSQSELGKFAKGKRWAHNPYKRYFTFPQKYAIINPERRWIYEGTEDNKSDTVRLDIQHESLSCGLPLAVRTERKYYARYLTYRTLPSEPMVCAIMADYPLLAAHATEATDLPKDHL